MYSYSISSKRGQQEFKSKVMAMFKEFKNKINLSNAILWY